MAGLKLEIAIYSCAMLLQIQYINTHREKTRHLTYSFMKPPLATTRAA